VVRAGFPKSLHLFLPAVLLAAGASGSGIAQSGKQESVWRNPQNSVHVRIHPCGKGRCGTVIWANDKAKKDSARGGTPNLVGTQLFREFRETKPKVWSGKVFVPDLNKVFSGTATITSATTAVARGCLLGKIGCKSETWTRIE
jgi:uncharacterized protein (DUF2147 family)